MAGETKFYGYTAVNHVVSGASISAAAFSAASDIDTSYDNATNLAPLCDVILTLAFGTAPTAGGRIHIYRRDRSLVSTNNEPDIDASFKSKPVGSVIVDAVTATQYLQACGIPLPLTGCDFFLLNDADQAISAGWNLDIKPYTFAPGA